ncbi:hypothetical protein GCM10027176_14850 [Actinoallomurus bryophytorum]
MTTQKANATQVTPIADRTFHGSAGRHAVTEDPPPEAPHAASAAWGPRPGPTLPSAPAVTSG